MIYVIIYHKLSVWNCKAQCRYLGRNKKFGSCDIKPFINFVHIFFICGIL